MRLVLLSFRNLARNKRRTIITSLAILFGALAIVVLQGFSNGFVRNIVETTVQAKIGAVQVFRKGYIGSDDPLKLSMKLDPAMMARIASLPGVTGVTPRIDFDGMVSNGSEGTMFIATAIDPKTEYLVCPKRKTRVAAGSKPLLGEDGHNSDALIGKTLAQALGAKQGSTLVMQSAGPHAGTNALDVEVSGFLPSISIAESKRMATVTLPFAQDLLRMKGQVTQYVIAVDKLEKIYDVAEEVRGALGKDFDVTTWRETDPATRDRTGAMRYVLLFIAVVLFLLVATGIINTMLMSVYERVREIGTKLAVGVRRWQVMALFLGEAIALGLIGSLGGTAIGYVVMLWLSKRGLEMQPPGGDTTIIYPHIGFGFLGVVIGFSLLGTTLAALYPAWKASRLHPVEALRAT